jgi:hypothetical protein
VGPPVGRRMQQQQQLFGGDQGCASNLDRGLLLIAHYTAAAGASPGPENRRRSQHRRPPAPGHAPVAGWPTLGCTHHTTTQQHKTTWSLCSRSCCSAKTDSGVFLERPQCHHGAGAAHQVAGCCAVWSLFSTQWRQSFAPARTCLLCLLQRQPTIQSTRSGGAGEAT